MNSGLLLKFPNPTILCHPHIPKPLHGLNPRTINGKEWWDVTRKKVYQKYNYHCVSCGVHKRDAKKHKWLEGHEFWEVNYNTGECKVDSIQPLCHYCHQFIHSGYLSIRKDILIYEKKEILQHGFNVLKDTELQVFPFTYRYALKLNVNTFNVKPYKLPDVDVGWHTWHLLYNNKKYYSKYKNVHDWHKNYKE